MQTLFGKVEKCGSQDMICVWFHYITGNSKSVCTYETPETYLSFLIPFQKKKKSRKMKRKVQTKNFTFAKYSKFKWSKWMFCNHKLKLKWKSTMRAYWVVCVCVLTFTYVEVCQKLVDVFKLRHQQQNERVASWYHVHKYNFLIPIVDR